MESRVLVVQHEGRNSVPMLPNMKVVLDTDLDYEITEYAPTHVVFEELVQIQWLDYLIQQYPTVKWLVQISTGLTALTEASLVIDLFLAYVQCERVALAISSEKSFRDIRTIVKAANPAWSYTTVNEKVLYLPTYYPHSLKSTATNKHRHGYFHIAAFDIADNLFIQAVAALEYANMTGKVLHFHVGGEELDGNVEALFAASPHKLVRHPWMAHNEFISLLKTMDVAMQVSCSESFNIVAADCVVAGIPIVVSSSSNWVTSWCQAEPTDSEDIVLKLVKADDWRLRAAMKVLNLRGLRSFCENSRQRWLKYLSE